MAVQTAAGVAILAAVPAEHAAILTVEAQQFVATLHRVFNPRRKELLKRRDDRQKELDAGRCGKFRFRQQNVPTVAISLPLRTECPKAWSYRYTF